MALVLNEEQQMLKESAKGFLTEHAPISVLRANRDAGSEAGYSGLLWPQMVNMGWAAILIPEEYGGLAFGHVGMAQIIEETGRTLTASPLLSTAVLGVTAINLAGNQEQKTQLLAAIASGELTTALAVDESAHHCPAGTAMSAECKAGDYILNGVKRSVVDGSTADKLIVAARTSGEEGDSQGITLFLVDRDAEGVVVERTVMVDGRNSAIISFNDVSVKASDILGAQDKGYSATSDTT
ncbi:MAG: acyl-CoA/acyl-ACP dehydrogenase, partial [Porticoccaceae bacterium]|nr:acyl-CoA/acyl-ACP dehydrogenase [Porticoccaceae bacterium]